MLPQGGALRQLPQRSWQMPRPQPRLSSAGLQAHALPTPKASLPSGQGLKTVAPQPELPILRNNSTRHFLMVSRPTSIESHTNISEYNFFFL